MRTLSELFVADKGIVALALGLGLAVGTEILAQDRPARGGRTPSQNARVQRSDREEGQNSEFEEVEFETELPLFHERAGAADANSSDYEGPGHAPTPRDRGVWPYKGSGCVVANPWDPSSGAEFADDLNDDEPAVDLSADDSGESDGWGVVASPGAGWQGPDSSKNMVFDGDVLAGGGASFADGAAETLRLRARAAAWDMNVTNADSRSESTFNIGEKDENPAVSIAADRTLTVHGVINAPKGIRFADGSVQTSAPQPQTGELRFWPPFIIPTTGAGRPTFAPQFIGQFYIDTTLKNAYIGVGKSSLMDWKKINN